MKTDIKADMQVEECQSVTTKDVEQRMVILRKQLVLLDADVAELYGVEIKRVNEAVRNNPRKFPYGYIFELDKYEKKRWSKISTTLRSLNSAVYLQLHLLSVLLLIIPCMI